MKDNRLSPEDPKLTAYALGELPDEDRAAVEAALRGDPAAQEYVAQTRAFAAQLEKALAGEAEADVDASLAAGGPANADAAPGGPPASAAIIPGRDAAKLDGGPVRAYGARRTKLLQFPQLYYVIGALAAACVAVIVALREDRPPATYYQEIYLGGKSAAAPAAALSEPKVAAGSSEVLAQEGGPTSHDVASPAVAKMEPPPPVVAPEVVRAAAAVPPPRIAFDTAGRSPDDTRSLVVALAPPAAFAESVRDAATPMIVGSASATSRVRPQTEAAPGGVRAAPLVDSGGGVKLGAFAVFGAQNPAGAQAGPDATTVPEAAPSALPNVASLLDSFSSDKLGLARGTPSVSRAVAGLHFGVTRSRRPAFNTEAYAYHEDNAFVRAVQAPFSTFAIDVDTASYANVRRYIENGRLPPPDAVRIEELINYFPYRYAAAEARGADSRLPVAASLEVAEAPWAPSHRLVRIGLAARDVAAADRPAANLVFLVDVSGSMHAPNKLPLVKESLRLLVEKLRPDDRVAIVTYATGSSLALPSTSATKRAQILDAIDALTPSGSTNGAMGLQLAYDIARANFRANGINRVILCTDGDFNVGPTSHGELARLVAERAKSGVTLTALGFGMGNYKDSTLELLSRQGNGNYGYIDSRREAEKLLVRQLNATLTTVAKDVKVQVDFNPAKVESYRLIGYENRVLRPEDFNRDAADGGELGAGHVVTALYEIVLAGAVDGGGIKVPPIDPPKYLPPPAVMFPQSDELLTVKLRYQPEGEEGSRKAEFPLTDAGAKFAEASADFKFAAAVAEYGMILRDSPHRGTATLGDVIAWAAAGATKPADDPGGYRGEFIDLARRTQALMR